MNVSFGRNLLQSISCLDLSAAGYALRQDTKSQGWIQMYSSFCTVSSTVTVTPLAAPIRRIKDECFACALAAHVSRTCSARHDVRGALIVSAREQLCTPAVCAV